MKCFWFVETRQKKTFKYIHPEWDPESNWNGHCSYDLGERLCRVTKNALFFNASKDKERTIRSQSDWKRCPTEAQGCPYFIDHIDGITKWEIEKEPTPEAVLAFKKEHVSK